MLKEILLPSNTKKRKSSVSGRKEYEINSYYNTIFLDKVVQLYSSLRSVTVEMSKVNIDGK